MRSRSPAALAKLVLAGVSLAASGCSSCNKGEGDKADAAARVATAEPRASVGTVDSVVPTAAPAEPAGKLVSAQTGFDVKRDAFKFQNYGDEIPAKNLGPAEMRRMFGDKVCGDLEGETCVLTPSAELWMEEQNKGMAGGHCEGMAVLALMMQLGKATAKDFGAETAHDLEITGNEKLQREIAFWWAHQSAPPISVIDYKETPAEVVRTLSSAFAAKKETYTLGFYLANGEGGHATTAYGVVDKGEGKAWILHYDNNFPNEERHIEVDLAKNSWRYQTAANPTEPEDVYEGDAETKSLQIVPTAVRMKPVECDFCGDVTPDAAPGGDREIVLDGDGDLLIKDDQGHRVGHDDGKLVNEIPGARIIEPRVYRASHHEPNYRLPAGKKLTVLLDGSKLKKESPSDVVLFGPGYVFGVYGVKLDPSQKDEIQFETDAGNLTYTTQGSETPTLEIALETPGPDYRFVVRVTGEASGKQIHLTLDTKAGRFALFVIGKAATTQYEVELHRVDKGGEQVFEHKGLSVGASDAVLFDYGSWKGNHKPLTVMIDKDRDGVPNETKQLTDDK